MVRFARRLSPAYSGLAVHYYVFSAYGIRPVREMAPWAKSAGEKGLPLDRANSEAHSVLVILAVICHYDWKVAETQHRKAVATEPVPHMVRMGHAQFYLLP